MSNVRYWRKAVVQSVFPVAVDLFGVSMSGGSHLLQRGATKTPLTRPKGRNLD